MAKTKAKELGQRSILALPKLPPTKADEVPHWKCWRFTYKTGIPWEKEK